LISAKANLKVQQQENMEVMNS